MVRILVAILFIYLCFKWGDWKHWQYYYPTILYYIIGDLSSNILTYSKPLWLYGGSFWNHTFANYFMAFALFPSVIILFLSNLPNNTIRQIWYIVSWIFTMSVLEFIGYIGGGIYFHNGWNIGWSILFYTIMFPMLLLHYKKPIFSWTISIALAFSVMAIFDIPLSGLK